MAICDACGIKNPAGARFCSACGTGLGAAPAPETRRTVTVVFSDIVGSTALGERLDAEATRAVMSRFYQAMRSALERYGGTVEGYIGDAVLALFGIPELHEDDALRAVRAAVQMQAELERLNAGLQARFGVVLRSRTGVNTGEVVAGNPAEGKSFVVGDAVNLAARLEQAAGPGEILLGRHTHALVRDAVRVEAVEPLALKGKSGPVPAFRLLELVEGAVTGIARRLDSPLVGRSTELERLLHASEEALDNHTSALLTILGSAGVGKSKLSRALVERLNRRVAVLEGRCLPYGEGITFWPVAEVIRQAAGIGENEPRHEAEQKLAAVIPADDDQAMTLDRVASAIGLRESESESGELFWAVRKVLESLAAKRPLLVVFDDVQWGAPLFLDFIQYVCSFSSVQPLLVLCLARPELLELRPQWTLGIPRSLTLRLEPLVAEDCARVTENVLGEGSLSAEVASQVAKLSGGNPLFVEELVRMLLEDGVLRRDHDEWTATIPLSEMAMPATIQALLAARLDRLSPPERGVLESGSVVGQVFWWGAVTELAEPSWRSQLAAHLQALSRRELVHPDASTFAGEDAFRFGHLLIRDAAYQGVLRERRADLHERFAAWLQRRVGARIEEFEEVIGHHLQEAYRNREALGLFDEKTDALAARAAERLAAAGRRAASRGDAPATAALLGRAAALWPPTHPSRVSSLPDLAATLHEIGRLSEAEAVLTEAVQLAQEVGDRLTEWRARLEQAALAISTLNESIESTLATAQASLDAFHEGGSESDLARAWDVVGQVRSYLGDPMRAIEAYETAAFHARQSGDLRHESHALTWVLISVWVGPTPAAAGVNRCQEVLASGRADRRLTAHAWVEQAPLLAMLGRFAEAREVDRLGTGMLEELGLTIAAAGASQETYDVEMLAGEPAEAERRLWSACAVLERMGERGFLSTRLGCLADAVYAQRRYAEAEQLAARAKDLAAEDDLDAQVRWRRAQGKALARRGEFVEAERLGREAAARIGASDFINDRGETLMDLAEILLLAGRKAEAHQALRDALELFERKGNLVAAARARRALAGDMPAGPRTPRADAGRG